MVFHFDISGNDIKVEHLANNQPIFFTLFVFHIEISGKDINDEQPQIKPHIIYIASIPF